MHCLHRAQALNFQGLPLVGQVQMADLEELFIQHLLSRGGSCLMSELGGTSAWKHLGEKGQLQAFLESKDSIFVIEQKNQKNPKSVRLATSFRCQKQKASKGEAGELVAAEFQRHMETLPEKSCDIQELAMLPAWMNFGNGLGKLQGFLQKQGFVVQVSRKMTVVKLEAPVASQGPPTMALRIPAGESEQAVAAKTRSAYPADPEHVPYSHVPSDSAPDVLSVDSVDRASLGGTVQAVVSVTSLGSLSQAPASGSLLWVDPGQVRWTHDKLQRLFTCGRSLTEVAQELRSGQLLPSDLPRISLVFYEGKWYSRNNRRLWCFKTVAIHAVQVEVSSVDEPFLRGLTTTTDGLTVDFWPPCLCSKCGREFPNRKGIQMHLCTTHNTSAIDWDNASEASESSEASEDGAYGEDGLWHKETEWTSQLQKPGFWTKDGWGRTCLWRAAATGNKKLLERLLAQGAVVDEVDAEGVSPLLAAVRRGHWRIAEALLWAGAFQQPWKWTLRKGKKWSSSRAAKYDRLLDALNAGRGISTKKLKTLKKKTRNKNG